MIEFAREAYDDVIRHAYRGEDEEVCGILAGDYGAEHSVVTAAHEAENVADTPQIRYYMDPQEQFELTEEIEDAGLDVVGFYHSHPSGGSTPSETDADRATWPDYTYAICALDGYPYLGAWRWRGERGAFERETVKVA